ncbi:hypothetical protein TPAU25S_00101 [Tsukamurella paurometabola]
MFHRRLVRGVHLAVVVTATPQAPDLLVGHVLDQFLGPRIAAEEVLTDEGAVVRLEGLVVAVRRGVHDVHQRAVAVLVQQLVPLATPDHLDHVPAGTAEEGLQLLDDLAVAPHRPVESLQVAVDHEGQVVEALGRGDLNLAARFGFVHLTVAQERPDVLIRRVLDAAVVQVMIEARLHDRVHRAQTHRHRRELPEVRQQTGVRVRGKALALVLVRLLLAEAVHPLSRDTAFEERAGVDAGGGVTLNEHLVAAARVLLAPEEVVEAHLVQRRRAGVGGDVPADAHAGALGAVDHDRGVPSDPGAVPALDLLVAGEPRLEIGGDGVHVIRGRERRDRHPVLAGALQESQHQVAGAGRPVGGYQVVERLEPFAGLLRVDVRKVGRHPLADHADPVRATVVRRCGSLSR